MREAERSFQPSASHGFSKVGALVMRTLTVPPPPRRVGVNGGSVVSAWAMPAWASHLAATGALTPSARIRSMNCRRDSVPDCVIDSLISSSPMAPSLLDVVVDRDTYATAVSGSDREAGTGKVSCHAPH